MRSFDEKSQIERAIQNWASYTSLSPPKLSKQREEIDRKLRALDLETATAADVARIIGNGNWVSREHCGECGEESWNIVELGGDISFASETFYVCIGCLRQALRLAEENGGTD